MASFGTLVGIRTLDLTAADATIEGEDIGAARVRATNSSVALDLRAATGSPDLDFGKGTQATLVLPSPCVFSLESAEEARERVELVGCEIYDARQRLFAPVGKRVILARVKVEAGATAQGQRGILRMRG